MYPDEVSKVKTLRRFRNLAPTPFKNLAYCIAFRFNRYRLMRRGNSDSGAVSVDAVYGGGNRVRINQRSDTISVLTSRQKQLPKPVPFCDMNNGFIC